MSNTEARRIVSALLLDCVTLDLAPRAAVLLRLEAGRFQQVEQLRWALIQLQCEDAWNKLREALPLDAQVLLGEAKVVREQLLDKEGRL